MGRRDREKQGETREVSLVTSPRSVANATAEREHALESELRRLRARLDTAERRIQALADAGAVLARGLQAGPLESPGEDRAGQAGRLAHELLLAAGLIGHARPEETADLPEGPRPGGGAGA